MINNSVVILIVDDDEAIRELVSEGLIEDGYTCDTASNADEALAKLRNHPFNVALLDIRLPGESGIELLMKFQTLTQNTKIIMMTAVKDLGTAVQAMKMGASDYVVKPFTIDELKASISSVLESRRMYYSISDTIQAVENINNEAESVNRSISAINTIACGVDAQVDYFDFHSKIVTEKTIDLARRLGLSAKEIEKWANERNELCSERNGFIKSALSKLERNPLAQVMLGLTNSVYGFPKLGGKQN